MGCLTTLPNEILDGILDFIDVHELLALFTVNRQLRQLCLPRVYPHFFRTRTLTFSVTSFQNLVQISKCPHLAPLVREICYRAPLFLSKELEHIASFANIFPIEDYYMRRQNRDLWPHIEFPETYGEAHSHIAEQYRLQASILENGTDTRSLAIALPHLVNLSKFSVDIYAPQECEIGDLTIALRFLDGPKATSIHHLFVCMEAFRSANSQSGTILKSFVSRGTALYPLPETWPSRQVLYSSAFSGISELGFTYADTWEDTWDYLLQNPDAHRLPCSGYRPILECSANTLISLEIVPSRERIDFFSTFDSICLDLAFPRLEQLKLGAVGVRIEGLEEFFRTRVPKLSKLTLFNVWFTDHDDQLSDLEDFRQQLEGLERIGKAIKGLKEAVCTDIWHYDKGSVIGSGRIRTFERLLKQEIGWREASTLVKTNYVGRGLG